MRVGRALNATTLVLITATAATAAEEHHGGGTTPAQWMTLIFTCINFFLFVFLLWKFVRVPLQDFLRTRRKSLVDAMSAAAEAKAEADRLKQEYETKLAALDETRRQMIAELRAIAESDRERALEAAREAAERMRSEAERTAQVDLERAKRELRAEAARLAAELAAGELRQRLDDQVRERLVREFLKGVAEQ